jgi:hypothetical protein
MHRVTMISNAVRNNGPIFNTEKFPKYLELNKRLLQNFREPFIILEDNCDNHYYTAPLSNISRGKVPLPYMYLYSPFIIIILQHTAPRECEEL